MVDKYVEGVEELTVKLRRIEANLSPPQLEIALMVGMQPIQAAAVRKAPVLTGTLRRSIHTETRALHDGAEARTGTNVEYAKYQEFGTSRMRARPYLRPAFDENKRAAVREIGRVIKKLVTP
jgi:HK97 gp10 family phage protein